MIEDCKGPVELFGQNDGCQINRHCESGKREYGKLGINRAAGDGICMCVIWLLCDYKFHAGITGQTELFKLYSKVFRRYRVVSGNNTETGGGIMHR